MFFWNQKIIRKIIFLFVASLILLGAQPVNAQCTIYGCASCQTCNSGNGLCYACPAAGTCSNVCGTAPYVYANGCCGTSNCPGNVDATAPPIPVPTIVYTPDGACVGKYYVAHSWKAVTDVGCWGMNSTPYWSQVSQNAGYTSTDLPVNTWGNYLTQTTVSSYTPGSVLYTHVKSRDAADNQSSWTTTIITVPSPTLYPTIHVDGPLSEDINRVCYPMSLLTNITLEPVVVPALGVTPICTMPTTSSYSCNFIIDNQKGGCVSPNITVTMNATYSGYGTIGWRTGPSGGECTGSPTSRSYAVGNSETNIPIYLAYNTVIPTATPIPSPTTPPPPTATPLPTATPMPTVTPGGPTLTPSPTPSATPTPTSVPIPTPAYAAGWFKLSGTSFNSRMSNRQNYIPRTLQKYDATNDDSIADHHIMIGSSGLLLQNGPVDPGSNAYESGVKTYSTKNWFTNGYVSSNTITYSKYIDYIKARKNFTTIVGAVSAASFPVSGVYNYVGDVALDPTWFDGKNIVFVVQGAAAISSPTFAPTNGTLAVLSNLISIDPSVTEINAILIGAQISTGNSDTNPLKIRGNLIDEQESGMILGRTRINGTKPSLFIVFDPQMYLNILPYLSTSTYDWSQTQ